MYVDCARCSDVNIWQCVFDYVLRVGVRAMPVLFHSFAFDCFLFSLSLFSLNHSTREHPSTHTNAHYNTIIAKIQAFHLFFKSIYLTDKSHDIRIYFTGHRLFFTRYRMNSITTHFINSFVFFPTHSMAYCAFNTNEQVACSTCDTMLCVL